MLLRVEFEDGEREGEGRLLYIETQNTNQYPNVLTRRYFCK